MRAITITAQGDPVTPNVAVVDDWPEPAPAAGEVLVRTEASALNHLDLWVGRGLPGIDTYPRIGGSDGCGRVEAVGDGVDEHWIGRRVVLNAAVPQADPPHPDHSPAAAHLHMLGEAGPGTHQAMFTAPAANVLDVGDADPVEAAAFALSSLTAWRMIATKAGVQAGQTVLVTGIGGGVALSSLAILKWLGCTVLVTSRHQWKLDRAIELGADDGVLDTGEDWSRSMRGLTGKRGVHACIDSVGQAVHESCLKSLARGGVFVTCGCTSGPMATTDLARVFWNQLSILGSTMGDMDEFRSILTLFTAGHLKPILDSVHDVADAPAAWARLESGEQFGKIALQWS
ncbi:MAG: zinc-binding dehydrogenase [Phycisphaerales bacterium]|nr:zinc-binding dehydrogenase [Phycisphaerales bacterium]